MKYSKHTDGHVSSNTKIKTYEDVSLGYTVTADYSADFSYIKNVFVTSQCGGYVHVNGALVRGQPITTWRYNGNFQTLYFHILYVLENGSIFEPNTAQDNELYNITVIGY